MGSRPAYVALVGLALAVLADRGCLGDVDPLSAGIRYHAEENSPRPSTMRVGGVVYEDQDGNGERGESEPAITGIRVSNGIDIVLTNESGSFDLEMPLNQTRCIFPIIPAEYDVPGNVYVRISDPEENDQAVEFGLRRRSDPPPDRFTIVQITDTHVGLLGDLASLVEDVEELNELAPPPDLVLNTGDIADQGGTDPAQYEGYVAAMAGLDVPLINIIGNHDYPNDRGAVDATRNWETYLGPRYFSFDYGRYHFVCLDSVVYDDTQRAWVEKDLSMIPQGQPILVFLHYLPSQGQIDFFSQYNTKAMFSGHWHGTRETSCSGIMNINTAPHRFAASDRTARGFRIVDVDGDSIRVRYRFGGVNKHIAVVSPPRGATVPAGRIPIVVNAYDTATMVERVEVTVREVGPSPAHPQTASLRPEGDWSWFGVVERSGPGEILLEATAHDARGRQWRTLSGCRVDDSIEVHVRLGTDWPMFHGDACSSGVARDKIRTPLALAWVTNTGGAVNASSPVVAGGKACIGTLFAGGFDDCGVACMDARNGALLWHAKADSSIRDAPCVGGGLVYAASTAGTLYAYDADDGSIEWTAPLPAREGLRWDTCAPKYADGVVYAGRGDYLAAFDGATGDEIWHATGMASGLWLSTYASPAVGERVVYAGSGPGVIAFDRKTGECLWQSGRSARSPVLVGDTLYCRCGDPGDSYRPWENALAALDAATGELMWELEWRVPQRDSEEVGCPAVVGGGAPRAYVGGANGRMMLCDGRTGERKGDFAVEKGIVPLLGYQRKGSTIPSSPAVSGDLLVFGATDGYLYILDRHTLQVRQSFFLGAPIASSPGISGNAVFIAACDGNVYCFASLESAQ